MRQKIDQVRPRLGSRWEEVVAIQPQSLLPAKLRLCSSAGAPSQPADIHIPDEEVNLAIQNAMYVRDRFTILELNCMLNLSPTKAEHYP
jgi:glycerol dehydrogenase-like iron-containing ADH family enzyme